MLAGLASIAAVVLAVAFAFAALAKARDLGGTVAGLAELGLPRPGPLAVATISVEAALAVGLVLRPGWSGLAAVAVLVTFTVALMEIRQRGNTAPCHCFGARLDTPVGRGGLARNGVLIVLAVLATQTDRLVAPWT